MGRALLQVETATHSQGSQASSLSASLNSWENARFMATNQPALAMLACHVYMPLHA